MCQQPEDQSSCTEANGERKYNHDCQREPVNQVGTECVVFEPVHKTQSQAIRADRAIACTKGGSPDMLHRITWSLLPLSGG
jgi:hypothetical protein